MVLKTGGFPNQMQKIKLWGKLKCLLVVTNDPSLGNCWFYLSVLFETVVLTWAIAHSMDCLYLKRDTICFNCDRLIQNSIQCLNDINVGTGYDDINRHTRSYCCMDRMNRVHKLTGSHWMRIILPEFTKYTNIRLTNNGYIHRCVHTNTRSNSICQWHCALSPQ